MSYITLAELQTHLRLNDSNDDPTLLLALEASKDAVDEYCERSFDQTGTQQRLFYPDHNYLCVTDDIADGNNVEVQTGTDNLYTTWASTDFVLEPLNNLAKGKPATQIRAIGDYTFPCVNQPSVLVTTKWGWPDIPSAVRQAQLLAAAHYVELRSHRLGVVGFDGIGVTVRVNELPHVARLLSRYRKNAAVAV